MSEQVMKLSLKVWRQASSEEPGAFEEYEAPGVSPDMSFLEMLDVVNDRLLLEGKEPIAFDHDCREGICGSCGVVINGQAHGPQPATTTCQLHMREFKDGDELVIEPWRARAFKVVKDLMVDRAPFDSIIQAGGYISARTGSPRDANEIPIAKENADLAMDAAACIGCGACVAACPNASASLFTAAKLAHLSLVPQGDVEAEYRVQKMVGQMEAEGFGHCTNHNECEAACPKEISVAFIARMNRQFLKSALRAQKLVPLRRKHA